MSLLTQFFQQRHKGKPGKQTDQINQTIASIFSSTPAKVIQPKTKIIKKQNIERKQKMKAKADKKIVSQDQEQEQPQGQQQKQPQVKNKKQNKKKSKEKIKKSTNQENNNKKVVKNQQKINLQQQNVNKKQKEQQQQQPEDLDSTIFIGNVPISSTHKSIKKYFQKYGKVLKVWFRSIPVEESKVPKKALHILKKYQQGADSMNAYAKFQKQSEAKAACSANGQQIQGKNIKVTMCKQIDVDYQTTIFIGNLPKKVKDQQLWDAFKNIGQIKSVRVIRNNQTHEGIGIGYIRFDTKQTMKKAISEMNGKQVGGRPMRIKKAVPKQRLQKKFKKLKEKKQNKFKKSYGQNNGKGNSKGNAFRRNQQQDEQGENQQKFINKTKPIHKQQKKNYSKQQHRAFIQKTSYPPKQNYTERNIPPQNLGNDVIRSKFGFKGTKKTLQ